MPSVSGDSGGPLLVGDEIVGVTSCHNDGDWPAHREEYYARVDVVRAWNHRRQRGVATMRLPGAPLMLIVVQ